MNPGDEGKQQSIAEPEPSSGDDQSQHATGRNSLSTLWTVGAIVAALLLYLVLADLAIESALSGSRVRWVVLAIFSGYLMATVLLWRRLGWSAKARLSFSMFLAILVITAWFPEGTARGVVLFGQPTSNVLSVVTALAVAFSGLLLAGMKFVPHLGKLAISLLTVYGVAAFIYAAVTGSSYSGLFQGDSLWSRLPFWLQGGFLGAFLLVPLTLLFYLVESVRQLRKIHLQKQGFRVAAIGMSLLIAVAGLKAPAASPGVQMGRLANSVGDLLKATGTKSRPGEVSLKSISDQLQQFFPAFEASTRQSPQGLFDAQSVVRNVGGDTSRLFRWVRDQTFLVSYQGVLRGPTGVLIDRVGNSLDRALLLHDLLREAGQEVRLAHSALSPEQVGQILQKARPIPRERATTQRPAQRDNDDLLRTYARRYGLNAAELRSQVDRVNVEHKRAIEAILQRVYAQSQSLMTAVGKPTSSTKSMDRGSDVSALQDHWWVQTLQTGGWVDLDPTLPNAEPGMAIVKAQEEIGASQLPSNLYHEVRISAIVEQWKNGTLNQQPAFDYTLRPLDTYGLRVALSHYPLRWPHDLDFEHEKDPVGSLKATILAQDEWLPVLRVGSEVIVQSSFTNSGEIIANPSAPILGSSGQRVGTRVGEILGSGRVGQAPGRGSDEQARLTAEWIEYEIRSPGRPSLTIRREIFDLLGPGGRSPGTFPAPDITELRRLERGLTLIGEIEVLLLASQLSHEFVEASIIQALLANRDSILGLLSKGDVFTRADVNEFLDKVKLLPGRLYPLALARQEWSRFRGEVYVDRPNILSYRRHLQQNPKGEVVLLHGFDIVMNDVAVQPKSGTDPFIVRLEQGVLDSNAEAVLIQSRRLVESVADIVEESNKQGISLVTVRKTTDPSWRSAELPKDVRERVEKDLAVGFTVVIPAKMVSLGGRQRIAWWRVNQVTGHTLGIGERGWGQSASEYFKVIGGATVATVVTIFCISSASQSGGAATFTGAPRSEANETKLGACILGGLFCAFAIVFIMVILTNPAGLAVAGSTSGLTLAIALEGIKGLSALCGALSGFGGFIDDVDETFRHTSSSR